MRRFGVGLINMDWLKSIFIMERIFLRASIVFVFTVGLLGCRASFEPTAVFVNEFIVNQIAYVPFRSELVAIDISNPHTPHILGRTDLQFNIVDVGATSSDLFVIRRATSALEGQINSDGGVVQLNISDGSLRFVEKTGFPPFPQAIAVLDDKVYISGNDKSWALERTSISSSSQLPMLSERGYNTLLAHNQILLAGGGTCSFRTGACSGWLDQFSVAESRVERLYEGEIPIFDMKIIGDRLMTFGRGIMFPDLDNLANISQYHIEYLGGSYGGVMEVSNDDRTFYLAEAHEIIIYQFDAATGTPSFVSRESSAPIGTYFTHLALKDDYLFAVSSYGFHVIDVSDPYQPFGVVFVSLSENAPEPVRLLPQPTLTP